jgi:hypothetical protein
MSDRAEADAAIGSAARVLYATKYDAGTNFILFAVAVELNALTNDRELRRSRPREVAVPPKTGLMKGSGDIRRCEMQSIRAFSSA